MPFERVIYLEYIKTNQYFRVGVDGIDQRVSRSGFTKSMEEFQKW